MRKVVVAKVVQVVKIDLHQEHQRIDNYLIRVCKGVPKTRIYRALRKGEVRVNQKRVKADYRLMVDDVVRVPPFRQASPTSTSQKRSQEKTSPALLAALSNAILQETPHFIIINKPAGIPVHGGTGIHTGLIEAMRELRPHCAFLELVHRIDRETSGCLMLAKKRAFLLQMHDLFLNKKVSKHYFALVQGRWSGTEAITVSAPLRKNELANGQRIVVVDPLEGKAATTVFRPVLHFSDATLVDVSPWTGRTHQIRVHAAHIGHPIAGDEKYGNRDFNKYLRSRKLSRLFLHATSMSCRLSRDPDTFIGLCAPLSPELQEVLTHLILIEG